jgi:hypothetical protein
VSRIDQPEKNNHGWYVRIRVGGVLTSKFYSDRTHKSRQKALRAAVAFRDDVLAQAGRTPSGRSVMPQTARNTSGIVGVAPFTRTRADGEPGSRCWVATWNPQPGKVSRKFFSVESLGERGALLAACAYRRDREREIYGTEIRENWAAAAKVLLNL